MAVQNSNTIHVGYEENPIRKWIHDHPTITKMTNFALGMFGVGSLCYSYHSHNQPTNHRIIGGAVGALSLLTSAVAYQMLDIVAPPTHTITNRVFTPDRHDWGYLEYKDDIPVLTLTSEDPYQCGYAHGWLLAEQINILFRINAFAFHTLKGLPRTHELTKTLDLIKAMIPPEYLKEIEGLVEGYQDKVKTWWMTRATTVTVEDVLFLHLLPDIAHLDLREMELWAEREDPQWDGSKLVLGENDLGCTVVVDGTEESGPIFGRNLDWNSLGVMGTYSLILQRKNIIITDENGVKHETRTKTVEVAVPGIIGTLSGMNEHGLCLAMNVSTGSTSVIDGVPAVFYNRLQLSNYKTVEDVVTHVVNQKIHPIGPYHLSVADKTNAVAFHFFQDKSETYHMREWGKKRPLITTNFRYTRTGRTMPTMTNSAEREAILKKYYEDTRSLDPNINVKNALALHHVNNIRTTHSMVMKPKDRSMTVALDNGWAASRHYTTVDTATWFHNAKQVE